ncbi:hypothetical protein IW146_001444 [Coemansia sp. RSA 922]|nr:hypothetical protein GGI14_001271 [Coemansia sp. S680]KAJ2036920.1 hypothetical protein H4S03_003328 [Coemansia sp. S3946]KAJ2116543.1 hypothetical protein IW146_001444 [Coemansia sp. RSA 922]
MTEVNVMNSNETRSEKTSAGTNNELPTHAPHLEHHQTSSRLDTVTVNYDFSRPIFVYTKGIRTTNVRISKATDTRWGQTVHVEAQVSSLSTTLHSRLRATSKVNERGEYVFALEVDWSIWDLGMTSAELSIIMPIQDGISAHPGIRVEIPSGSLGATLLGNTHFQALSLSTDHGPAHLSDVAASELKLTAHYGNITVHDISSEGLVEIVGRGAWMDIDDVRASSLVASSMEAIISLKDIDAKTVSAATTNARVGLGNVKADTLTVATSNGDVMAENVFASVCEVKASKGNIEGSWYPKKKLYLSTSQAKISAQVLLDSDNNDSVDIVLNSTKGPIDLRLPASFVGGFSLETTGLNRTYIHTVPGSSIQPVLHVSKTDKKAGLIGDGSKRHSLRANTDDAPITVNFGSA